MRAYSTLHRLKMAMNILSIASLLKRLFHCFFPALHLLLDSPIKVNMGSDAKKGSFFANFRNFFLKFAVLNVDRHEDDIYSRTDCCIRGRND